MTALLKMLSGKWAWLWAATFYLLPGMASANVLNPPGLTAWDVYAFGNGQVMMGVMESIALMVNDPVYAQLLGFLAILGFFVMVGSMSIWMSKNNSSVAAYGGIVLSRLFSMLLVVHLTLGIGGGGPVTSTIIIIDVVDNTTYTVQDVPAIIAVPASLISVAGQELTALIEKNFSLPGITYPDELKISNGGKLMLAASMIDDASQVQINDPSLRQSIALYVQNCAIPMMANGSLSATALVTSPDVWGMLQSNSPAVHTIYYNAANPAGTAKSCMDAYALIDADITAAVPELLKDAAGAWNNTTALSYAEAGLDSALLWMSANGSGAIGNAAFVRQSAVINMMQGSYAQAAAATNNNELMMNMALEQAKQSQVTSWRSSAEIFKATMGYIYSVLQAFVYAISPLVFVLILGFGGKMLGGYLTILVWLALWNPLLAIINFIVSAYGQADLMSTLNQYSGTTIASAPAVTAKTSKLVAAAGYLATLIPVFSYGILKGTFAMTEFVSSGLGTAFANSAASQATTGSVSLDNQSMGNMNMNQKSFASKSTFGSQGTDMYMGMGASTLHNAMGGMTNTIDGKSQAGVSTTVQSAESRAEAAQLNQQYSESQKRTDAKSHQITAATTKAIEETFGLNKASADERKAGTAWSRKMEGAHEVAAAITDLAKHSDASSREHKEAQARLADGALKLSGGKVGSMAAKVTAKVLGGALKDIPIVGGAVEAGMKAISGGVVLQDTNAHSTTNKTDASTGVDKNLQDAYKTVFGGGKVDSANTGASLTDSTTIANNGKLTDTYTTTLSELSTAVREFGHSRSETLALSQQIQDLKTTGVTVERQQNAGDTMDTWKAATVSAPSGPGDVRSDLAAAGASMTNRATGVEMLAADVAAKVEPGVDAGKKKVDDGFVEIKQDVNAERAADAKAVNHDTAVAKQGSAGARADAADHVNKRGADVHKEQRDAKTNYNPENGNVVRPDGTVEPSMAQEVKGELAKVVRIFE